MNDSRSGSSLSSVVDQLPIDPIETDGDTAGPGHRGKSMKRFLPICAVRVVAPAVAILLNFAVPSSRSVAAELATTSPDRIRSGTSAIDSTTIKADTATSRDWPTVGLDCAETRYFKLRQITSDNVGDLGLVWSYSLDSDRG